MSDDGRELGDHRVPGDGARLRLSEKNGVFTISVRDTELMSSDIHGSEDALAELVCARIAHVASPAMLIGGLGMGFTLAAALKGLGPAAKVTVAELMPAVVEWNRGPLAHLAGRPLEDGRVTVLVQDVAMSLQTALTEFDAILLDVDNGPEGLTRLSNDWLYTQDGLAAAYTALRPGGILAVWSSVKDRNFTMRMRKAGFEAEEIDAAERHVIFLGVNRA